jgi:hypothetical protein
VPAGISGSLNELFDPEVVNQITFQTGGWDAEYGNKNAAIVNVTTKIPSGGFHGAVSIRRHVRPLTTVGPSSFNGQTLSMSGNKGSVGTLRRRLAPVIGHATRTLCFDQSGNKIINFHNSGNDAFGFAKLQYTPSARRSCFARGEPVANEVRRSFDSSGGASPTTTSATSTALNLGWHHQFARPRTGRPVGAIHRTLRATREPELQPEPNDDPQFVFFPDTTHFDLSEQRSFNTYGIKADFTMHPSNDVEFKVGTLSSITNGHEILSPSPRRARLVRHRTPDCPVMTSRLRADGVFSVGQGRRDSRRRPL